MMAQNMPEGMPNMSEGMPNMPGGMPPTPEEPDEQPNIEEID